MRKNKFIDSYMTLGSNIPLNYNSISQPQGSGFLEQGPEFLRDEGRDDPLRPAEPPPCDEHRRQLEHHPGLGQVVPQVVDVRLLQLTHGGVRPHVLEEAPHDEGHAAAAARDHHHRLLLHHGPELRRRETP